MILVIGATGFIGTYLLEELKKEKEITGTVYSNTKVGKYLKDKSINIVKLDISKKETFSNLPTKNVEAVILLSGLLPANVKGEENKEDYIKINVEGTLNVLEFCRKNKIKKLISTTSYADVQNLWKKNEAILDDSYRDYKYTGDHAVYVFSKNMATDLIIHYAKEYGMENAIFRLPPVYGVGPHGKIYVDGKLKTSGIETFINKAITGEKIEIWGDGQISRDIVYVKDVVQCIIKAIKSEKLNGVYNLTSGKTITLEEQVKIVVDVFSKEKKSEIIYRYDKENNGESFLFSIDKARKDLNYEPKFLDFKLMMQDYKKEMENFENKLLIESRKK